MISEKILSQLKPGTVVKVFEHIKEGGKEREAQFQGLIIARKHGSEVGATITVRGTVASVGIEKIYPIHSPSIARIEIISTPQKRVRRAKLYYLRNLSKRKVRQKVGS